MLKRIHWEFFCGGSSEIVVTDFYNIWIEYDMDPPKIRVIQYYYFDV
jgi:hypothetical protein